MGQTALQCRDGAGVDTAERVREGASVFTPKGVRSAHCVPSILVVSKILHLKPPFFSKLFSADLPMDISMSKANIEYYV